MSVRHYRPLKNITKGRSRFFLFYATVSNTDLYAVGPNDGSQVPPAEVHVLGGGDLAVTRVDGTTVTIIGIPAGAVLPIEIRALVAAGSTATNVLVLW